MSWSRLLTQCERKMATSMSQYDREMSCYSCSLVIPFILVFCSSVCVLFECLYIAGLRRVGVHFSARIIRKQPFDLQHLVQCSCIVIHLYPWFGFLSIVALCVSINPLRRSFWMPKLAIRLECDGRLAWLYHVVHASRFPNGKSMVLSNCCAIVVCEYVAKA